MIYLHAWKHYDYYAVVKSLDGIVQEFYSIENKKSYRCDWFMSAFSSPG